MLGEYRATHGVLSQTHVQTKLTNNSWEEGSNELISKLRDAVRRSFTLAGVAKQPKTALIKPITKSRHSSKAIGRNGIHQPGTFQPSI